MEYRLSRECRFFATTRLVTKRTAEQVAEHRMLLVHVSVAAPFASSGFGVHALCLAYKTAALHVARQAIAPKPQNCSFNDSCMDRAPPIWYKGLNPPFKPPPKLFANVADE